jgi:hypothetical protein
MLTELKEFLGKEVDLVDRGGLKPRDHKIRDEATLL